MKMTASKRKWCLEQWAKLSIVFKWKNAEKHKDFSFFMSDTKTGKVTVLPLGKLTKEFSLEVAQPVK